MNRRAVVICFDFRGGARSAAVACEFFVAVVDGVFGVGAEVGGEDVAADEELETCGWEEDQHVEV